MARFAGMRAKSVAKHTPSCVAYDRLELGHIASLVEVDIGYCTWVVDSDYAP